MCESIDEDNGRASAVRRFPTELRRRVLEGGVRRSGDTLSPRHSRPAQPLNLAPTSGA